MNDSEISEELCWRFMQWCEKHKLLNGECGLSTIEYIRSRKSVDALEYINDVLVRHREKPWKMPEA